VVKQHFKPKIANNNKTKLFFFCRSALLRCASIINVYCLDRGNYLTWSGSGQVATLVVVKGKAISVQAWTGMMAPGG